MDRENPNIGLDRAASSGPSSQTCAAASAALAGGDPDSDEDHFLHLKFVDKKGNPVKGVKYDLKMPDNKKRKFGKGKRY